MPEIIPYTTEAEWLELRKLDITSSDVACLFDESPYSTEFEMWHRKKNGIVVKFDDSDRVKWGRRYEAPTAEGLAEDHGWKIKPLKVYIRHDNIKGMGSSFDYEIEENGELGILEIKTTDYKEYKTKWISDGEEVEAPIHIELQLQHQLEVADRSFGYIAVMIGGNKPVVMRRDRDRELGKLICEKIETFWKTVTNSIEPLPDFARDGEIIKMLYADVSGDEIDLSGNNRFNTLISEYIDAQQKESLAKKLKDAAKTEMITFMENAGMAKCGDAFVTRKNVVRKSYEVKESSYADFRIKQSKGEK